MQIKVLTLTGKTIHLEVESDDTVLNIRKKVSQKEGIPLTLGMFVFNGHEIFDDQTLREVGIKAKSEILLILKLRGD